VKTTADWQIHRGDRHFISISIVSTGGQRVSIAVPTTALHMMQAISATKTGVAGAGNTSES
jgi:hypothetical protein